MLVLKQLKKKQKELEGKGVNWTMLVLKRFLYLKHWFQVGVLIGPCWY